MTTSDRRGFLRDSLFYSGAALFAPSLSSLVSCARANDGGEIAPQRAPGYGPLRAGGPELLLPSGFSYTVLSASGREMSNGDSTPTAFDGMAAFPLRNGNVRLLRNHENRDPPGTARLKGNASLAYDRKAGGCVTSLEVRTAASGRAQLVRSFVGVSGTIVNCAGGMTPWGTWLTCEESTEGAAQGWEREHGYVFEVPADAESEVPARPIRAMGRFVHEAVAVDPRTGIVYETEDQLAAGFYRFIPTNGGRLAEGGVLQVLAVADAPRYDTSVGQKLGEALRARWITIEAPDPPNASSDASAVFRQGHAKGAAVFTHLEGCWYGDNSIYFNATNGGNAGAGQVWQYRPRSGDEGDLMLVFESPSPSVLHGPDNITVSSRGGILLCEDSSGEQFLRGLTPDGGIFDFARTAGSSTEFCGACFSPDGRFLFVNIQGSTRDAGTARGMTFAITGPWERGPL